MGLLFWTRTIVLVIGGVAVAHGGYMLVTGRVSNRARAAFRSTRDAGMYSLCLGLGLVFLALGGYAGQADSSVLSISATVLALVCMGLAFVRYRPRKPNPVSDRDHGSPS